MNNLSNDINEYELDPYRQVDYGFPEGTRTTKVKVTLELEIDVLGWAKEYYVRPNVDQTLISAVKADVKEYFATANNVSGCGCSHVARQLYAGGF
tara:strand:- start:691 stop:975 length:285 start_codon:yes stop_codon:yes gene_type:complete